MKSSLTTRLVAEGLGTGLLVCTVVGSGIMAERLAGGNQAIALLGNTIQTGAIHVVLITIFGPLSGAHFNPAVTVVLAALGKFSKSEIAPYIIAQCVSGIAGTILAHLMFDLAPLAIGTTSRTGASQLLAEAVATFSLALLASDIVLHSPMLRSVHGKVEVEAAVGLAHAIQSASSYTSIIATPDTVARNS